LVQREMKFRVF